MENHFELAFQNMPTPAFIIDRSTGQIRAFNRNFALIFENRNTAPGNDWHTLSKDETPWPTLSQKIADGSLQRCECNVRVGDKTVHMQLTFQLQGDSILSCVYSSDHMDLAAAENTLLQFALSESSAGLWIWETDSDLTACSESIALLLGCPQDQTPRSTVEWHNLVHPDDVRRLANLVNQHVAENKDYYEVEYRIRRSNQEYLWVKERGRTYTRSTDGDIKKIIGFVVDISHQKELEEHLRNQATFDELTGLLTRAAALTHFKKQLGLAKRQYTPLSMAKIHLDANQRLSGLPLEERNIAILTSARHIYKKIREADVLARVEADKLLLLLPNTSIKDAQKLLMNIIVPTSDECSTLFEGNADPADFCVGLATFPEDGETIDELAQSANQAVEEGQSKQQKIVVN